MDNIEDLLKEFTKTDSPSSSAQLAAAWTAIANDAAALSQRYGKLLEEQDANN
jgi:hypothetical protein